MTTINDSIYTLLSAVDKVTVRNRLEKAHKFFYHGTIELNVDSIKQYGLDPKCEGEDSHYSDRKREPRKAMRFCTEANLELALNAAQTRAQVWDEYQGTFVTNHKVVVFRIAALSLLGRSFGLDHSHSCVSDTAEDYLTHKTRLSADEFIKIIDECGAISCYDAIPAEELEICTGDVTNCSNVLSGRYTKFL